MNSSSGMSRNLIIVINIGFQWIRHAFNSSYCFYFVAVEVEPMCRGAVDNLYAGILLSHPSWAHCIAEPEISWICHHALVAGPYRVCLRYARSSLIYRDKSRYSWISGDFPCNFKFHILLIVQSAVARRYVSLLCELSLSWVLEAAGISST